MIDKGIVLPSSAESKQLLLSVQDYAKEEMQGLLEHFLGEAESHLIQLAQHSGFSRHHALSFEAIGLLKRNKDLLRAAVVNKIDLSRAYLPVSDPVRPKSAGRNELQLLDLKLLDAQLALQSMLRRSTHRWSQVLYGVEQRCGRLLDRNIDTETFSMGVIVIGQALYAGLLESGISLEIMPRLIFVAERSLIQGLGDIYTEINDRLKRAGVLPTLEVSQWPTFQRMKQQAQQIATEVDEPAATEKSVDATSWLPEVRAASRKIWQQLRETENTSVIHGSSQPLSRNTLLKILTELNNGAESIADESLLEKLSTTLASHGEQGHIDDDCAYQLQLSQRVIDELTTLLQGAPQLTELVQKLHIPLAGAALLQTELFEKNDHPAHQMVNSVGELCERSDVQAALFEQKISLILDPLTSTEDLPPPEAFATAADELDRMREQQLKARDRSIQRLVETCIGQQRLAQAQGAVDHELYSRLAHIELPQLVVDLVQNGWRELLRLVYLRNGDASLEWIDSLNTIDELLWSFDRTKNQQISCSESEWLLQTKNLTARIKNRLGNYFHSDFRHATMVKEIRDTLLGRNPIILATDLFGLSPRRLRSQVILLTELEHAYPDLLRWFRRAREFKTGDRFAQFGDSSRQPHTLIWIDDNQQRFVFVNARGGKTFDFDLIDLAKKLAEGLYRIEDSKNHTLIERAISHNAQAAYEQIAFSNTHDAMTGLLNRREFSAKLEAAMADAKTKQKLCALLYIDVDHFALINDLHGHVTGDQALQQIAQRLSTAVAGDILLARIVGNEFAVLLDISISAALEIAEVLRLAMGGTPFMIGGASHELTVSIGLVEVTKYSDSSANLLRAAGYARGLAKNQGRDRVFVLDSDMEVQSRRDRLLGWVNRFTAIMESDELVLRAQPITSVNNIERHEHFEVLLGLRGEKGELLSPGEFIEAAECYNRMQRVDRWVLERAFAWIGKRVKNSKSPPRLSINLSANSLNEATLFEFVVDRFGVHGVLPRLICFEVTETATIDNLTNVADFIRQARKIGCTFALDDFGTGHSSYEYLKQLPVDYLKIDGMFIVDIDRNPTDFLMVKSINEIAHAMGIKTIAEFVEREEILITLREIGVDYAQGYAVGKPILLELVSSRVENSQYT